MTTAGRGLGRHPFGSGCGGPRLEVVTGRIAAKSSPRSTFCLPPAEPHAYNICGTEVPAALSDGRAVGDYLPARSIWGNAMRGAHAVAVVLLALAAPAQADTILFWSTTGIDNSSYIYNTAETNFLPYFVPPTPVQELPAGTYDLFFWGRFTEEYCLPPPCSLYGMDLIFGGNATVLQSVAYRHRKTGSGSYDRWDGSLGIALDGVMAAVTSRGIEYLVPPDDNNDLYYPETQEFLVGAAQISGLAGQTKTIGRDSLGLVFRCSYDPCQGDPWGLDVIPAVVTFFALGDLDGDNLATFADIDPFVFALSHNEAEFKAVYPAGHYRAADCNQDGMIDFDDIDPFVALLGGQ